MMDGKKVQKYVREKLKLVQNVTGVSYDEKQRVIRFKVGGHEELFPCGLETHAGDSAGDLMCIEAVDIALESAIAASQQYFERTRASGLHQESGVSAAAAANFQNELDFGGKDGIAVVEKYSERMELIQKPSHVISLLVKRFPHVKASEFNALLRKRDHLVFVGQSGVPSSEDPFGSVAIVQLARVEEAALQRSAFEESILAVIGLQGRKTQGNVVQKKKGTSQKQKEQGMAAIYVAFLATHPKEEGRGHGKRLGNRIEQEAHERRCVAIFTQASLYDVDSEEAGEGEEGGKTACVKEPPSAFAF
uniref:Uncharacterized protein n=1 Tax=Chromera velia CCMP2878 TaxID=1169474 RepID=A0A0G4FKJ6_9ALVE|eukprot:Cvel_392.t1-p1 / transcript=Cvel_392.t1 / gene=Cvel_392 / organism=Chromera_velia_CCMP2878 / gene_product=hypothetical protein / transcript_product=hypothetical protein / location=Cvel_scaffold13:789-3251(-) / protein_length=304 / sequence_SO=supercontig / SO=protein_coding / is_pseudo=false